MEKLSKEELQELTEAIATAMAPHLVKEVKKDNSQFWIDSERHWRDHKVKLAMLEEDDMGELRQLIDLFKMTKGLFTRAFLGLVILGSLGLVTWGFIIKFGHPS